MKSTLIKLWKSNKTFVLFMVLMFVFRSSLADWNAVPTGSMKPTIIEGDRILVNKLAYDVHLPFTDISVFTVSNPVRGDIVIFDSAVSKIRLVKRVVGEPGDKIELKANVLYINGERLSYENVEFGKGLIDQKEDLVGVEHLIRVNRFGSAYSSFAPIVVPQGYYFVLGDNRDNSADSRAIGLIPRSEIVGRTNSVVMSLNYDNYYLPRADRFFKAL